MNALSKRSRSIRLLIALAAPILLLGFSAVAQACPMCSETIAGQDALPRAYMFSILFMLAMPATVFSGFGLTIYLKIRNHAAQQQAELAAAPHPAAAAPPQAEVVAAT
jgi:hypothetical protein